MITIDNNGCYFAYRVAGVALCQGHVLLHRSPHEEFWTLPGGRCEMREQGADALQREMREELNADVTVPRLLWIVENFFDYGGRNCHEIGLYFIMQFTEEPPVGWGTGDFPGREGDEELIFRWYPLDRLHETAIYPTFLSERLLRIPDTLEHVVHVAR